MKIWDEIGGRKFLALVLACVVYGLTGTFDFNLALIFAAYMGANVLTKFVNGKDKREVEVNHDTHL